MHASSNNAVAMVPRRKQIFIEGEQWYWVYPRSETEFAEKSIQDKFKVHLCGIFAETTLVREMWDTTHEIVPIFSSELKDISEHLEKKKKTANKGEVDYSTRDYKQQQEHDRSFVSVNNDTQNKQHKKRRLTLDKTPPADDSGEVTDSPKPKRLRVISKEGSPICESVNPSPDTICSSMADMETSSTSSEDAASEASIPKPRRLCVFSKQGSPSCESDAPSPVAICSSMATTETSSTSSEHAATKASDTPVIKNQAFTQARQDAPTKPPFSHVLLGNVDMPCEATMNDCSDCIQVPHPEHCNDSQTDGVLSSIEMEYAWLCEESLHCLQGEDVAWSFVYKHASYALQVHLRRHGTDLKRLDLADAMNAKRKSVRALLMQGYRRPHMKKIIALYRLAIQQGCSFEQVWEMSAATKKQATLKTAPTELVAKKESAMPPQVSNIPSKGHVNETALPEVGLSKILTKNESEVAWLLEESILQNAFDGIDYQYVLEHASPVLRSEIERHKRRWLPRVVRLNCSSVKSEFEEERDRIYQLLCSGYRRPETKAALPAGRVTISEYKKQLKSQET
jgi:hypothetical protein